MYLTQNKTITTINFLISEYYETLEGEGFSIGIPTLFIRFTGCNYNCSWCDTKYAIQKDDKKNKEMTLYDLLGIIENSKCQRISLTGGEPLIQNNLLLLELINKVKSYGTFPKKINLETNGSIYAPEIFDKVDEITMDIKPPSSGMATNKSVLYATILKFLSKTWFKIVVFDNKDLEFVDDIINFVSIFEKLDCQEFKSRLYLQPATIENNSNDIIRNKVILKLVKDLPTSRYGVRLHKMLSIP